jgi:hypothetical protein
MNDKSNFQRTQREFNALYPFLKIVFSTPFDERWKPSPGPFATVNMAGTRTVAQLVKDIRDILGLSVIIQRKFGELWIGTFLTADWTLDQQNREGENISRIR